MKNIIYILLIVCFISCKHSKSMKSESADMEIEATEVFENEINLETIDLEELGSQKLIEYFDLLKLKQLHPEFETDINEQLLSFTNNNSILNYPEGFTISNIKQLGTTKIISDSLQTFTIGFDITTASGSFKDSLITEIKSKEVTIGNSKKVSHKVRFLKIE